MQYIEDLLMAVFLKFGAVKPKILKGRGKGYQSPIQKQINELRKDLRKRQSKLEKDQIVNKIKHLLLELDEEAKRTSKRHEENLIYNIKSNPRAFYKYVESSKKSRTNIGPLRNAKGIFVSGQKYIANEFAISFANVFSITKKKDTFNPIEMYNGLEDTDCLHNFEIEIFNVLDAIRALKPHTSPGQNDITIEPLKCSHQN